LQITVIGLYLLKLYVAEVQLSDAVAECGARIIGKAFDLQPTPYGG
jgi:hypothetical protein